MNRRQLLKSATAVVLTGAVTAPMLAERLRKDVDVYTDGKWVRQPDGLATVRPGDIFRMGGEFEGEDIMPGYPVAVATGKPVWGQSENDEPINGYGVRCDGAQSLEELLSYLGRSV